MKRLRIAAAATATLSLGLTATLAATTSASADNGTDAAALIAATTADGAYEHLEAYQAIADAHDGNRAAGTPGHVASAEYVESVLQDAGYTTKRQPFTYDKVIVDVAEFALTAPTSHTYTYFDDYYPMDYTGEGDVSAPLVPVDVNLTGDRASTSGCEATDFTGFPDGAVALVQRGTCAFADKAVNAEAAGASAVVIFNQGNADDRMDVVLGTLGEQVGTIPVFGTSFDIGAELAGTAGAEVHLAIETHVETVDTFNVLADTAGRSDRIVVVGGHLDSVAEGPGVNDNGSGTAAILELAEEIAASDVTPRNKIRFAFWSGEEDGLIGSDHYVAQLSKADIKKHAVNLNFDMVASPNPVRFVYDGDGDAFGTAGPTGSDVVEDVFNDHFADAGLATVPTEFDGRSDYFGFINAGIPAGGLFTGAEGVKTAEEAEVFGGTAGVAYDPCYHSACDTIDNIDLGVFEEMIDAIADATWTFGQTTSAVSGTAKGSGTGAVQTEFKGSKLQR